MTGAALDLETLARWAETARQGDRLAFASGELPPASPAARMVRGMVKGGGFSATAETDGAGILWHTISRDDPSAIEGDRGRQSAGALAPPSSLRQPPLDASSMAWWAVHGDEPPEWVRHAIWQAIGSGPAIDAPAEDWAEDRARLDVLLIALADLLDPAGKSHLAAQIGPRPAPGRPKKELPAQRARRLARARAIEAAELEAHPVRTKDARHKAADAEGLTARQIGASIQRERRRVLPGEAASSKRLCMICEALRAGGELAAEAERLAAAAVGMPLAEARKALKQS